MMMLCCFSCGCTTNPPRGAFRKPPKIFISSLFLAIIHQTKMVMVFMTMTMTRRSLLTRIQSCCILLLLLILSNSSSALEATFTPNPQDSLENGGNGGPLPASMQQRRQLLELEVTILNSQDPLSTLDHVAQNNGLSREELTGMLDRNRRDLEESGQLEGMLGEMHAAMQAQGGGVGGGGGGGQRLSMANSSLPRRLLSLIISIVATFIKSASVQISRHPKQSTVLAALLTLTLLAMHNAPRNGIVISSGGTFPPFSSGHTTLLEPPVDYLERYCVNSWEKGGGWISSLPESKEVLDIKKKSAKSKKKSTTQVVGGVGFTRSLEIATSNAVEGEVTVETSRAKLADGFQLITTAQTMLTHHDNDEKLTKDKSDNNFHREELECMIESAKSVLGERKFTEFVPENSQSMKFRSFLVTSEADDEEAIEGGVIAMKLLGDFGRYGVQPLCLSYETDDDENDDGEPMTQCVAFHTLKGGHFDGELRFLVVEDIEKSAIVISVTLAIPHGGRAPSARLAEALVSSIVQSIAQSILIRTKQTLSRRMQSKTYRTRASSRAVLKRHLQYEQEKAQEEMAAERKRKWKRNNPDAGHYRPSGHRLKSPNNC